MRSGKAFALLIALACASPAAALAQPSMKDRFEADKLFQEGKRLYGEGKYKEACEALATSDELDPAIGTLGLLAACREKQGDLVGAWKGYLETKRRADAKRDSRAAFAAEQAEAVKARLPKLTILSRGGESNLEVARDGESVPLSILGAPVPVNPGEHTISARSPGAPEWKTTVTLKEAEARTVEIPPLDEAGSGSSSGPPRWLAFVVGGVGLAGIGAGTAAGFIAMSNNEDSMNKKICPPTSKQCPERDTAFTAATISTVAFIAGGAGVAAGVVLFFVAGTDPPASGGASGTVGGLRIAPLVGPSGGGALLTGTF